MNSSSETFRSGLVSIMIPTYNQHEVIHRAIESCLKQTYKNIEIIIADDCSITSVEDLVLSYNDQRLKYFRNSTNIGRVRNYRKALYEYASGEWAVNLDGDDFFVEPTFIEKAVSELNKTPDSAFFFANIFETDIILDNYEVVNKNTTGMINIFDGMDYLLSMPRKKNKIEHLSTVYNRKLALELGFYELDIISSDYASLYKMLPNHLVIHWDWCIGVWFKHDTNYSSSMDIHVKVKNLELFYYMCNFFLNCDSIKNDRFNKIRIKTWYFRNANNYLRRIASKIVVDRKLCKQFPEFIQLVYRFDIKLLIYMLCNPLTYLTIFNKSLKTITTRKELP